MKNFVYNLIHKFGVMLLIMGQKIANIGDNMVSLKYPDEVTVLTYDKIIPEKISRNAMLGQRIAIFGDYISENIGRKISYWSWGKLHNNCLSKAPKTYLDDTGISSPDVPSPWVKTGCQAQTGSFKRFGCDKPEDMFWEEWEE